MGSKSTTVVTPNPKSPEEIALNKKQVELAQAQLDAISKQGVFQDELFAAAKPLIEQQSLLLQEQLKFETDPVRQAEIQRQLEVQGQLLDASLQQIEQGTKATPEQEALIEEIRSTQLATGESDISRFRDQNLESLREELAPSLGLRSTDTPILDRGARVAEEATRQQGQLERGLATTAANARLNFPIAAGQFEANRIGFQQQLSLATSGFQERLRQQAFNNRLNLGRSIGGVLGQSGGSGLGLAGIGTSFPGFNAGFTQTTKNSPGLVDIIGAVGGGLTGIGAVMGKPTPSHSSLKEKIEPANDADILRALESLPVNTGITLTTTRHIGPMAEDVRDALGVGDGVAVGRIGVACTEIVASEILELHWRKHTAHRAHGRDLQRGNRTR